MSMKFVAYSASPTFCIVSDRRKQIMIGSRHMLVQFRLVYFKEEQERGREVERRKTNMYEFTSSLTTPLKVAGTLL